MQKKRENQNQRNKREENISEMIIYSKGFLTFTGGDFMRVLSTKEVLGYHRKAIESLGKEQSAEEKK